MSTTRRLFGVLMVIFVILAGLACAAPCATHVRDATVPVRARLAYSYDVSPNDASALRSAAPVTTTPTTRSTIRSVALGGGPLASFASLLAAEEGGARFVVNGAGEALDTARVTIPEGKFGYLLENPSKAGGFADSRGLDRESSTRRSANTWATISATPQPLRPWSAVERSSPSPALSLDRAVRSGPSHRPGASIPMV